MVVAGYRWRTCLENLIERSTGDMRCIDARRACSSLEDGSDGLTLIRALRGPCPRLNREGCSHDDKNYL
jgi:hypothetical protein